MGNWRKSSHSKLENCIEAGSWRVSSACEGGACIEVGTGPAVVGVRDSQLADSPVLEFPAAAWERFTASLTQY